MITHARRIDPESLPPPVSRTRVRGGLRVGIALGATAVAMFAGLRAAPTGVNNVPSADTSPGGTGVFQMYSAFGKGAPEWFAGVRAGLSPSLGNFEAGVDTRWGAGPTIPAFFNAKWAAQLEKGLPALGIGIAGVALRSSDRDALGQPQTYAVFTYDADVARFHAGYAFQSRNGAMFFGLDHWWVLANQKLTFRADITQIQNRDQWLASAGFMYLLADPLTLEVWHSLPTERGRDYTTVRLSIGFRY
ncbi:MAG: hypothetical protein Q7S40_15025 [Opitutaceae bacterium]|nr:hypothetical protein [Opitutaceae bacterium]